MISRALSTDKLIAQNYSVFIFGPRGTGKTSLLSNLPELRMRYDLLLGDTLRSFSLDPGLFRRQVESQILKSQLPQLIAVDEIQLLPELLNEVHSLIEKHRTRVNFILTGSSARKLKRSGANMLGGRAVYKRLHPLCQLELEIDLHKALQFGTLPRPYLDDADPRPFLASYVDTYLREEIKQEALVRKMDAFIRFLDLASQMNGENINYSKMGRTCGVAGSTIEQYYSILEDTLLVLRLDGWTHSVKKQIVVGPKYYLFDCGVLNALRQELNLPLKSSSSRFGKLFETFVINEVRRICDYKELDFRFHYWRTSTGQEVDLVLARSAYEPPIAIEIKGAAAPEISELNGMFAFKSENEGAVLYCVCLTEHPYERGGVTYIPWNKLSEVLVPPH